MYPDSVHGWAIPEQHLSEAAFLWGRLELMFRSPRHVLWRTLETEQRMRAHLDGLVVGGAPVANHLLKPALLEEDPPLVSAAASALLVQDDQVGAVLGLLVEGTKLQHRAVQQALLRCERKDLAARLAALPATLPDTARAAVLEVQALRGLDAGATLAQWMASETPALAAAALRAARAAPSRVEPAKVLAALDSPSPAVREAAVELGLRLGLRATWRQCQQWAAKKVSGCRRALELLAVGGEEEDLEALLALTREPRLRHDAVWALGFSGRVSVAEAALGWMRDEDPRFVRLAAEAFSAITGLVVEGAYQEEEEEEEPLPPLEEEDLVTPLGPDPEASLPRARPDAVEAWWKEAKRRFEPRTRYLRGLPLEPARLLSALRDEPMRRRHLLAMEVSFRTREALRLDTHTSAHEQQQWLLKPRTLREGDLRVPFKHLLTVG
ncbi:TIGR02270 family protein [Pyxidicoccus parkwayensis]|uniref:TIGR02270 family protein n=1 Tax=Pyxidicoccus parkwayensis TaxID=2813578 RepID=A0ABX7NX76_9BACT|nr:TIGR02270 family protein [Pyxidicoccus parkwaysis]QSQ21991.1 TIGR02270 family protein [Pyxidicoccus parkwaysis]